MTKDLFTVSASDTLSEVVADFVNLEISTAPVLDHMGDVLGLMSEMALVSAFNGEAYQVLPPFSMMPAMACSAIQVFPDPVGAVTRQSECSIISIAWS